MKEIIIFMTACKLVIGNYKGLYNANIWMSAALWGISGNVDRASCLCGLETTKFRENRSFFTMKPLYRNLQNLK